jgi:hypothetical protein
MKDGSIVKTSFALGPSDGMGPLTLTFREVNEIFHSFGRVFFKKATHEGTFRGIEYSIRARLTGHKSFQD